MEEEFKFIPLYALARCRIDSTYYVTGKVGYNLVEFQNYTWNMILGADCFMVLVV